MEARIRTAPALVMCTMVFVSVTGCDPGDEVSEDVEVVESAVTMWPPTEGGGTFQYGRQWSWASNGSNAVTLLPSSGNSCFLSSVFGDLRSGDEVSVGVTGGSQWVIRGNAPGGGSPGGNAFCMNGVSATARVDVVSGESRPMGVGPVSHTCFLATVRGPFNTSGSFVRLTNNGEWRLEAGGGASGSARCVAKPLAPERSISSPGTEVQLKGVRLISGAIPVVEDAINSTADGPYFCALTRVQGHLRGFSGAVVGTYLWPGGAGPHWKLREGSYLLAPLYPLSASARCAR
jgi:hypothetical protein